MTVLEQQSPIVVDVAFLRFGSLYHTGFVGIIEHSLVLGANVLLNMCKIQKFLLWVFVLFLGATDWSDGTQSHELGTAMVRATIQPRQLMFWSGGILKLNCNFSQMGMNASVSDFSFYSSNQEINEKLRTEIKNNSTIYTSMLVDRNMSLENISCRFRNDTLDEVTLHVTNPIECVVKNWESMKCSWEMFQLGYDSNVSLIYSRSDCWLQTKITCPNLSFDKTHGHCEWKRSDFVLIRHCFRIKIGMFMKVMGSVYVENFVKPNPVSNCHTRIYNSSGKHSAFISWSSPSKDQTNINYRVIWASKWSAAMEKNSSQLGMELQNLIPSTNYTVTIDCIPIIAGKATGFWSNPKVLTFVTAPDVPGASPKVTPGGFKEGIQRNASYRNIELFYQPPEERLAHGDVKGYRVNYSSVDSPNGLIFAKKETSVSVPLRIGIGYSFTVEAETASGYNTTLAPETIFISSLLEKPPFPNLFEVITYGNGSYFFSWTPVSEVSAYTVYWCNSNLRQFSCLDALQWKTVSSSQTSAEMVLTGLTDRILRFFISAERNHSTGHVISSGMLKNNCTYWLNGEPRPPCNFRVHQGNSTSLIAEWSQPDETCCQRRTYPAAYVLSFCSIHNCKQTEMTIQMNSSLESFEIFGLEPSTVYRIMIKSISEDGRESIYEQRNETTVDVPKQWQDKLFIVISVIGGFICFSFAIIAAVIKCCRWYKEKFDLPVVIPKKYATNTGLSPEHNCYSNFDSPSGKMDTIVLADSYDVARTPDSYTSETQTLLLKRTALSIASSGYTNETSLQSSSLAETSELDDIFVRPDDISGYNLVVEQASQSANVTPADSGNGLSANDNNSDNMDNLVMVGIPDA